MSMADKQPGGPAQELASAAEEGIVPPVSSLPAPVVASAEDPIYVSKREVRKNAGKGTSKKSTYFLEFYLVDNHGYETLAATGEDQGMIRNPRLSGGFKGSNAVLGPLSKDIDRANACPSCYHLQLLISGNLAHGR